MGMPELVVAAVLTEGRSKSQVARDYGVSRRWVVTLVQRYLCEGPDGLKPRSRRPHRSPTQTPLALEERIVRLRKELDKAGHEAGADTIRSLLLREQPTAPATSTIWRILKDRGFVTPQPHKRPKSSYCRFEYEQPKELWQTDLTHWALADGTDVEIGNWLDDHSRYCLDSRARRGGRVILEVTLNARGVRLIHSRGNHPQTCGKVERFHQTLKKHLATQPRATTIAQLQRQLDAFRDYYNNRRPHRSLHRRTPAEVYAARPKAKPSAEPLIDPHWRVRHDKIDSDGKLTLRHNSRLHHIGIGRRHAGTPVLILVKDLHVRITAHGGRVLRDFTLDPDRDYQHQPKT
jgi:transposase InsO family protein